MSELKATPGPWVAEKENAHAGCVATCQWDGQPWWEVWSPNWSDGGSAESNAHLIASAPSLYEALKQIVSNWDNADIPDECISPEHRAARAALAKARGES